MRGERRNGFFVAELAGSISFEDALDTLKRICDGAGPGPAQRGVEIARLLFVVDKIPKHERDRVRRDLLDYCHRDALAMVRLVETLEGLARVAR